MSIYFTHLTDPSFITKQSPPQVILLYCRSATLMLRAISAHIRIRKSHAAINASCTALSQLGIFAETELFFAFQRHLTVLLHRPCFVCKTLNKYFYIQAVQKMDEESPSIRRYDSHMSEPQLVFSSCEQVSPHLSSENMSCEL